MKKIDYTVRALFDEFLSEDTFFIETIIEKYNIDSILEIPCANGRNISIIGSIVSQAFFADINKVMVSVVQEKINTGKWDNCHALKLDLCDLSNFTNEVDTVLIMQQSFQMISKADGRKALQNLQKVKCKRIILDIYDFKHSTFDLPQFLTSDNIFIDGKGNKWTRRSFVQGIDKNWVHIKHEYTSSKLKCYSEVSLWNYSREQLFALCNECKYHIIDYYTDYSLNKNPDHSRTIVILEK